MPETNLAADPLTVRPLNTEFAVTVSVLAFPRTTLPLKFAAPSNIAVPTTSRTPPTSTLPAKVAPDVTVRTSVAASPTETLPLRVVPPKTNRLVKVAPEADIPPGKSPLLLVDVPDANSSRVPVLPRNQYLYASVLPPGPVLAKIRTSIDRKRSAGGIVARALFIASPVVPFDAEYGPDHASTGTGFTGSYG
jgi:hypothetical protein